MREYICGKNAVLEALKSNQKVYEVLMTPQMKDDKLLKLIKLNNLPIKTLTKQVIEKENLKNHQGIVLLVEGYQYANFDEVINKLKNKTNPLIVICDGLEDPHNLGAILRTADAVGVDAIIINKHHSVRLNATVAKVSVGAINYVPVIQATNLSKTINELKKHGYWVVGTSFENSVDYRKVDYLMPTALVIGSEGKGISRLVLENCDYNVFLPMVGKINSLNASVACAVMLYEIYNQRNPK